MYMKGEIFFIQYGLLLFTSNRYVTCDWTLTSQRQPRPVNSSALTGICGNMDGIPESKLPVHDLHHSYLGLFKI